MPDQTWKAQFGLAMIAALILIPLLFAGVFVAWLSDRWSAPDASSLIMFLRQILAGG